MGEGAAHVAEADDADGAAFQLQSAVGLALPVPLAHFGVGACDVVEQGEKESEGMLPYSVAVAFGRVEAADAEAFGIIHVDGFHACTHTPDAAQMAGTVEEWAVDDDFAAHHEGVVLRDDGQEGVVVEGGVLHHFMAGLAQEVVENGVSAVGDEVLMSN